MLLGSCGAEDSSHLLPLSLATEMSAKLLLGQLQSALITAHAKKLADALLIGSQSADLVHDAADELHTLSEFLDRTHAGGHAASASAFCLGTYMGRSNWGI